MREEKLSGRQLSVAVLVGGLSTAAAVAGGIDWRWMLAAVLPVVGIGWLLLRRVGGRPLHPEVRVAYCVWSVVLAADVLRRAAERIQQAAGGGTDLGWLLVLLALPLLWMGWGKAGAFFRAAEIFWLAVLALTAVILLLALPRLDWRYALEPAGDWKDSLLAAVWIMSAGLFALPHIYNKKPADGDTGRGLGWLAGLGALSAALALATAGLFSPKVAVELEGPFFAAAGLLGDSARLEGLVSALWLLPDLTLVGLLCRSWGERHWPMLGAALALGLALTGMTGALPRAALPLGSIALAGLTAIVPVRTGKIVAGP